MLGDAYAFGHLATAAISLAMGAAFALLAWRVPGHRRDLAYAVSALLCGAVSLAAMALALAPSLPRARLLFSCAVALYVSVPALWHVQFAREVLAPRARRRHLAAITAYTGGGAILIGLLLTGVLDGGRFRPLELGTAQSGLPALSWGLAVAIFLFACLMIPLSARLLAAPGPRRLERRSALPLMIIASPLCAHELMVAAGAHEMVPVGGYVAGLASLQGLVILAERFRALTEPRRLGPYQIEQRIGSGGMAEVFLARRTGAGPMAGVVQPVALKRLRPELARDPDQARRLIEEARVLARLSHPNIVGLLDAGQEDGELYLALELVDGASLARLIERGREAGDPPGRAAAIEVGAQVAAALACAHPAGLIHRDVSPQNLLVDDRGDVKLGDFGIARAPDRTRSTTGLLQGKLPYVAPEQLRGVGYDHRVDLHALGAVLHELLAGAPPYDGESDAELVYSILEGRRTGEARVRERGGEALADLIDRLLARDPDLRPRDAAEVIAALAPLRDPDAGRGELGRRVAEARAARDEEPERARSTRRLRPR